MSFCSYHTCPTQLLSSEIDITFPCLHCQSKSYCSLQCSKQDWETSHKFECLSNLPQQTPDPLSSKISLNETRAVPNKSKNRLCLEDYEIVNISQNPFLSLGTGSFSDVKLVRKKSRPENLYALKTMNKTIMKAYSKPEYVQREIKIQKKLDHPHIVKLYHCFEDKENVYMILEYVENGTLHTYLREHKRLSEKEAFVYFFQTALGLNYLHKKGIMHRDLKPENLLLTNKQNIKLCDFGWSAEDVGLRNTFCGTVDYMAPEMVRKEPHTCSIDMWSLGILLYELLHGSTPFTASTIGEKFQKILENEVIYGEVSEEAISLISSLLNSEPTRRPSFDQIFGHPWLKKYEKEFNISLSTYIGAEAQSLNPKENSSTRVPPSPTFHRNANFEQKEELKTVQCSMKELKIGRSKGSTSSLEVDNHASEKDTAYSDENNMEKQISQKEIMEKKPDEAKDKKIKRQNSSREENQLKRYQIDLEEFFLKEFKNKESIQETLEERKRNENFARKQEIFFRDESQNDSFLDVNKDKQSNFSSFQSLETNSLQDCTSLTTNIQSIQNLKREDLSIIGSKINYKAWQTQLERQTSITATKYSTTTSLDQKAFNCKENIFHKQERLRNKVDWEKTLKDPQQAKRWLDNRQASKDFDNSFLPRDLKYMYKTLDQSYFELQKATEKLEDYLEGPIIQKKRDKLVKSKLESSETKQANEKSILKLLGGMSGCLDRITKFSVS